MDDVERLMPDPDRRDEALLAMLIRTYQQAWPQDMALTERQKQCLEGMSRGLGRRGTADLHGISEQTVMSHLTGARRLLRAKDTCHAVAEALRRGLID